ncbi:motility protein A [bacterium]|nr:motility protein A [bacterium]
MDIASIGGFGLAIISLFVLMHLEHVHFAVLWSPSAYAIIFGGTIGATVFNHTMHELSKVPVMMKIAFTEVKFEATSLIEVIVSLAEKARREGVISLEEDIEQLSDTFLKNGLQLVVDGTAPEVTKSIMETQLNIIDDRHNHLMAIWTTSGGFAPTMGIIGTVMGVVHVLGGIEESGGDIGKLASGIALAFMATFFGIFSANVFFLPLGGKLKAKHEAEMLYRQMTIDGILAIEHGENPAIVKIRLLAYLPPEDQKKLEKKADKEG